MKTLTTADLLKLSRRDESITMPTEVQFYADMTGSVSACHADEGDTFYDNGYLFASAYGLNADEVIAASQGWRPTHLIVVDYDSGERVEYRVQLDDGCGYTASEWNAEDHADWEYDHAAGWLFQGRPTPKGNGSVEVMAL